VGASRVPTPQRPCCTAAEGHAPARPQVPAGKIRTARDRVQGAWRVRVQRLMFDSSIYAVQPRESGLVGISARRARA
jgi:hypothetical protein